MSGGSWDYLHFRIQEAADDLSGQHPARQALARVMERIAKAMHDVEWVDSGDYGSGDEMFAIFAVIGPEETARVVACRKCGAPGLAASGERAALVPAPLRPLWWRGSVGYLCTPCGGGDR